MTQALTPNSAAKSMFCLRGQHVALDFQIAEAFGVTTKAINRAVRRNPEDFPDESFVFRLTEGEWKGCTAKIAVDGEGTGITVMPVGGGTGTNLAPVAQRHRGRADQLPYAFTLAGYSIIAGFIRTPDARRNKLALTQALVSLAQGRMPPPPPPPPLPEWYGADRARAACLPQGRKNLEAMLASPYRIAHRDPRCGPVPGDEWTTTTGEHIRVVSWTPDSVKIQWLTGSKAGRITSHGVPTNRWLESLAHQPVFLVGHDSLPEITPFPGGILRHKLLT